ncbi:MAG: choice-of-anchor J domain-containing protein, partial [Polyangia bacterium]|nr:choice-of-anchor J domain-containing protein [Polyangia bacterium]
VSSETFATCPASGWIEQNGGGSITWYCQNPSANNTGSPSGGRSMTVASQSTVTCDDGLVTPVYNLSAYQAVGLDFYHAYYDLSPAVGDYGAVQYSTNGQAGPWTTIVTYTSNAIAAHEVLDVTSQVAGQANVAFRFYYVHAATSGDFWQVDDVSIRAY